MSSDCQRFFFPAILRQSKSSGISRRKNAFQYSVSCFKARRNAKYTSLLLTWLITLLPQILRSVQQKSTVQLICCNEKINLFNPQIPPSMVKVFLGMLGSFLRYVCFLSLNDGKGITLQVQWEINHQIHITLIDSTRLPPEISFGTLRNLRISNPPFSSFQSHRKNIP